MDREPLHRMISSFRQIAEPAGAGLTDSQLLERFVRSRDEAAFELLLRRHGPAVLGVCRRLLPHESDAEDAFQATFLILVRKAGSITRRESAGGWLYRVAYRVALRVRASLAKRRERDPVNIESLAASDRESGGHELLEMLDEEVNRLPARHRAAFVLCCLEGKSQQEAARELGCPPGTVSSRLTRAREHLRRRLACRGLAPAGMLSAVLSGDALAVTVPENLVGRTLEASLMFSVGAAGTLSSQAATYAEGVLRTMFLTRLKIAALLLLVAVGLLAGGANTHHALWAAPSGDQEEAAAQAGEARPGKKPILVRVTKPRSGGRMVSHPGTVQAFAQVDVFAQAPGILKNLAVDIGTRVKKDQLLAEVDAPLLLLAEKEALAGVRQAKGQVREAEAKVSAARAKVQAARSAVLQRQAELDSAKANQTFRQQQLDRLKRLAESAAVDMRSVSEAEGMASAARAQVAGATAAMANAKAEVEVKESEVIQAEAALTTSTANLEGAEVVLQKAHYSLGLTKITAPFDGVITQRNYLNGDDFRSAERGRARPLLTVQRTDQVRVVVEVPAGDVPLTEPGISVDLKIGALPNVRFPSYSVSRTGYVINPKTRTMRVEIDVPNPRQQLRPGMFGEITLHLKKSAPGELWIPLSCLATPPAGGKEAVYVVREGKAHRIEVRTGDGNGPEVEILSGLKPDDQVVTDARSLKGEAVPVRVQGR